MKKLDKIFMTEALREAKKAFEEDEVPVGAVVVYEGKVIAKAHNQIRLLKDPTAHAEMIALTQAAAYLKNERLCNCILYSTIEPCPMCAGALVLGRIERLIYGTSDSKSGACGSVLNIVQNRKLNHTVKITKGVLSEESSELLKRFFEKKRKGKRRGAGVVERSSLLRS